MQQETMEQSRAQARCEDSSEEWYRWSQCFCRPWSACASQASSSGLTQPQKPFVEPGDTVLGFVLHEKDGKKMLLDRIAAAAASVTTLQLARQLAS